MATAPAAHSADACVSPRSHLKAASSDPQGTEAPESQQVLSPDQSKLLAQIAGQLADSTRAEKEAACRQVQEACEKEHSRKRKQLEDAAQQARDELVKQHEAAMAEAAEMTARRKKDSQQFTYTVRGHATPDLSGSIPHQVFEAEPNSVFNKMYNGEWAYATDHQGRACINSDPAHWPLILAWLSFSSIPAQPPPDFIAECKYWQLDNLLAKIEEQRAAASELVKAVNTNEHKFVLTHIQQDGRNGFLATGKIYDFVQRFSSNGRVDTCFEAFGRSWKLMIGKDGSYLANTSSSTVRKSVVRITFGKCEGQSPAISADEERDFEPTKAWGTRWKEGGDDADKMHGHVDLHGCLPVSVKLLFQQSG